MITESSKNSKVYQEKNRGNMFDNFNVIGLQIVNPVILSIYSTCKLMVFIACDYWDDITHIFLYMMIIQ